MKSIIQPYRAVKNFVSPELGFRLLQLAIGIFILTLALLLTC